MLDYKDELGIITHLITEQQYGMTITSIAAASKIGRNRVAKYLDVLTLSGRVGMKQVGNAKVFFLTDRIPVASMLNLSSDFIIVLNDRHEVVYANDNLLNDEKLRRDDVIGTAISHLNLSLLPFPNLTGRVQQALEGVETLTEYAVTKGGTKRWFRAKMTPTALEGGAGGVGIMLEDITERKMYQAHLEEQIHADRARPATTADELNNEAESHDEIGTALNKSKQLNRTLIEHSREGILIPTAEEGIITFVNPAMAAMLGYTTSEMLGRSVFTLTNDAGVQTLRRAQSHFTENTDDKGDIQLFSRDGKTVHAEIISTPIRAPDTDGQNWLLLINDVTDRKRKENAIKFTNTLLTGIIEGSNRMIATIDTDYTFVSSNSLYQDEFERVWGNKPEAGKKVVDLLSHMPAELEKGLALWKRVLDGDEYHTVQTFPGGCEYDIWFFPLRDEEGNIYGAANILTDISNLDRTLMLFQEQDIQLRALLNQKLSETEHANLGKKARS
ncbi:PAS domain S-box protein [Methanogenium marinum]|uniref:PAS domain S-box protein n=1 Tax=Methanogenium marinum TaxID=348610 RepID=A0A9Q4KV85_9EURY|nr:PAS domain S-box protein [Methanogenium marinum]MDE4908100.1 PAS domain S-box protein [Methanogenium marinum]